MDQNNMIVMATQADVQKLAQKLASEGKDVELKGSFDIPLLPGPTGSFEIPIAALSERGSDLNTALQNLSKDIVEKHGSTNFWLDDAKSGIMTLHWEPKNA